MNQLKLGTIMYLIDELAKSGMTAKEIAALPIYIGRDDELNGIHTARYGQVIDSTSEDDADFIELINEDHCNIPLDGKAILIS